MKKTSQEMVKKGFQSGIAQLVTDPNLESGTVCQIGESWFCFGGMTAEGMTPEEFRRDIPEEDIVQEVYEALNGLKQESPDEYLYYYYILTEKEFGRKLSN